MEQDNCIVWQRHYRKGMEEKGARPRCCRGQTRSSSWIGPFMVATAGTLQKSKNSQKCNQKCGVRRSLSFSFSLSLSLFFFPFPLPLSVAAAAALDVVVVVLLPCCRVIHGLPFGSFRFQMVSSGSLVPIESIIRPVYRYLIYWNITLMEGLLRR